MSVRSIISFWSIALLCSVINTIHLGLRKIMGLQFVAFMERYSADREQTALALVLGVVANTLFSPVVGFVGTKFGSKNVIVWGCVIASFSLAVCFFAEHIIFITLCWGIPLAISVTMATVLLPSLLHIHYRDNEATANGIAFAGACISGVGFNPLYKLLLDVYGVSGSHLIMGVIALHAVPAAMLLANPKSDIVENKTKDKKHILNKNTGVSGNMTSDEAIRNTEDVCGCNVITKTNDLKCGNFENGNSMEIVASKRNLKNVSVDSKIELGSSSEIQNEIVQTSSGNINISVNVVVLSQNGTNSIASYKPTEVRTIENDYRNCNLTDGQTEMTSYSNEKVSNKINYDDYPPQNKILAIPKSSQITQKNNAICRNYRKPETSDTISTANTSPKPGKRPSSNWALFKILYDPIFLLISITTSCHMFMLVLVTTVLVDFGIDKGLSVEQGVYKLMCLNIADMIGRFSLGWVTDRRYISVTNFTALSYFFLAIFLAIYAVTTSFWMVMLSLAASSFFFGALMTVFNVIISQYFEGELNAMALASRYITLMPMMLAISPIIGFFRENLGSYVLMFYFIVGICILCCIIMLLLPTLARCRKRNALQILNE